AQVELGQSLVMKNVSQPAVGDALEHAVGDDLVGELMDEGVKAAPRQTPHLVRQEIWCDFGVRADEVVLAEPMDPSTAAREEGRVELAAGQGADAQQRAEDLEVMELLARPLGSLADELFGPHNHIPIEVEASQLSLRESAKLRAGSFHSTCEVTT